MVSFGVVATRRSVSSAQHSTRGLIFEERGLIKRLFKPGERQDYFQLAPRRRHDWPTGSQRRFCASTDADLGFYLHELIQLNARVDVQPVSVATSQGETETEFYQAEGQAQTGSRHDVARRNVRRQCRGVRVRG